MHETPLDQSPANATSARPLAHRKLHDLDLAVPVRDCRGRSDNLAATECDEDRTADAEDRAFGVAQMRFVGRLVEIALNEPRAIEAIERGAVLRAKGNDLDAGDRAIRTH